MGLLGSIGKAVGLSGGSSKVSGTTRDPTADKLADLAQLFSDETTDLRGSYIGLLEEILKTGSSRLPIFSAAEESTRQATSKAFDDTRNRLAQTGQTGTPFAQTILANQGLQGEQAVVQQRQNTLMELLGQIQPFILGQSGTSASGLSGAVGANTTQKSSAKGASGTSVAK